MTRKQMIAAGLTVGMLSWGGVALAQAIGADTELSASADTVTAAAITTEYLVEDAGSVTIAFDGSTIELVDQVANPGWSVSVDSATATEIEVDFVGAERLLRFEAEVEDGEVRVEVEDRTLVDDDDSDDDVTTTTIDVTETTITETTVTVPVTVPDDDSDNDSDDDSDDETSVSGPFTGIQTVEVTGYGTITVNVSASGLEFVSATGIDGWTARLDESDDHEVTVVFTKDGTTVEAELRIEDGSLRLHVEVED